MFCPKCGKELEQGSNFCRNCGCNVNQVRNNFSDNASAQYNIPKKSKAEFLQEYRSAHSEVWAYLALSIIFDIIGAIIIIMNAMKIEKYMSSSLQAEVAIWITVGLVLWVLGTVFIARFRACDNDAAKEYERYLYAESRSLDKVDANRVPEKNEWLCPKCGKINVNYVGTCGCGEVKPR
ncbi:MAG: zinc-ribbon domain-containing protein [Acutalibacteraceae bacterium]